MFHSEILASQHFNKNQKLFLWIGEQPFIEMMFWQFSNITINIRVYVKMPNQYFKVLLFSNPGDKVLILFESKGQICPNVLYLFWTLSHGLEKTDTLKCGSGIFQYTLNYMIMLKNCRSNISMHAFSQIQGTNYLFLLKSS